MLDLALNQPSGMALLGDPALLSVSVCSHHSLESLQFSTSQKPKGEELEWMPMMQQCCWDMVLSEWQCCSCYVVQLPGWQVHRTQKQVWGTRPPTAPAVETQCWTTALQSPIKGAGVPPVSRELVNGMCIRPTFPLFVCLFICLSILFNCQYLAGIWITIGV